MATVDLELMETKEYKAFAKANGDQLAKELLGKSDEDLKAVISSHTVSMAQATAETKAAPAYQKAEEAMKDFKSALKAKNDPLQKAVKLAAKVLVSRKNS
jgi:hypothetical protein